MFRPDCPRNSFSEVSSSCCAAALTSVMCPSRPGSNQSAADRLNDVLVQGLQVFQRAARVLQLHIHLPQLGRQQAGQIGDRNVGEQVDQNDGLQRFQLRMRRGIRRNESEVGQLQHRAVQE